MLSSDGWTDLIEDINNLKQPLLDITSIKTEQDLHYRKGQLDIINWLLNTEIMSEKAYNELLAEGEQLANL